MTLPFLEKLLQVLAQGGFSSTYKYSVLLGLIDLCVEAGHPPTSVTTRQLARRVVELYWPQVRPYPALQAVLRQNSGGQARIAWRVGQFRQTHPDLVSPPRFGPRAPVGFDALLSEVEWELVRQPLPLLQRVGGGEERFLYTIGWDQHVRKSTFNVYKQGGGGSFDNRILLQPEAAQSLVGLASVIRPLVQQHWIVRVQKINRLAEAELDSFLFGTERIALRALQAPLRALQDGRCFYCNNSLSNAASEVDHFLPWSRYPDDGVDNLVLAHDRCNREKLHFLADLDFGHRWEARSREQSERLDELAATAAWSRDRARTFGVVASVYQGLPEGVRLWAGRAGLRRLESGDLSGVHGFGRGLLVA